MKKILSLTLTALLLLAFASSAYAAGLYITSASNGISKSGTTVTASQYTSTNTTASTIKHVKYIQRYSGGSWSTYTTRTSYSYNTSSKSDSSAVSVPGGYSYRVVTYHYAYEGSTLVSSTSRTSGSVYVS